MYEGWNFVYVHIYTKSRTITHTFLNEYPITFGFEIEGGLSYGCVILIYIIELKVNWDDNIIELEAP